MDNLLKIEQIFNEEQLLIQKSIRKFVDEEINPIILHAYENAYFPQELIPKMAKLGLLGLNTGTKYGGSNTDAISYGLICAELERGDSAIRSFVSVQNSLCNYAILQFGSLEQKEYFLPQMSTGKIIGCFALTEPNSGSDPASMQTTAHKVKGGWRINGNKLWITNATIAQIAIVWAKTEENIIQGFLIDTNDRNFIAQEIKYKGSLRASTTGEIFLDNIFVPQDKVLPLTNNGLSCALKCLNQARYGIAWGAIGAAEFCYNKALNYALARKQFNKYLASNQLIQHKLVSMYDEIIKAKLLNLHVGKLKAQNNDNHIIISLIKRNACKNALNIARLSRSILGGNGICLEYDIMRHMQNLETVITYEGTDDIHELILGEYLTGISAF